MGGEDMIVDCRIHGKGGKTIDAEFSNERVRINGALHMYAAARDVTERKRLEKKLKNSIALLENIHACLDEAVFVVDPPTRTILSVNAAAADIFGYRIEDMIGRSMDFLRGNRKGQQVRGTLSAAQMAEDKIFRREFSMRKKDGTAFPAEVTIKEVLDDSGHSVMHVSVVRDITQQKKTIGILEKREKDLEELNVALKVLLDQREQEKNHIEESFSGSIIELIIPYLERIRKSGLNEMQDEFINILESNLREIVQPFKHRVSDKLTRLSPSETRITNYLRQGYSNKEIAAMLNLSPRTIEFHRDNIRKKLGLKNRKVNLRTFLAGLP
jgi:PAS domain S-box-containing protein